MSLNKDAAKPVPATLSYERQLTRANYIQGVLNEAFPINEGAPGHEINKVIDERHRLGTILESHFNADRNMNGIAHPPKPEPTEAADKELKAWRSKQERARAPQSAEWIRKLAKDIVVLAGVRIMELNVAGEVDLSGLAKPATEDRIVDMVSMYFQHAPKVPAEWMAQLNELHAWLREQVTVLALNPHSDMRIGEAYDEAANRLHTIIARHYSAPAEGWQWVPKEPTDEQLLLMFRAFHTDKPEVLESVLDMSDLSDVQTRHLRAGYVAALAAAPKEGK